MNTPNQKFNMWSEAHGRVDDATQGLGGDIGGEVADSPVKRCILLTSDCVHCGRQCRTQVLWPEVAHMAMQKPDPEGSWRFARQGVMLALFCNGCRKPTTALLRWHEVHQWVDIGIRSRCLPPQLLRRRR